MKTVFNYIKPTLIPMLLAAILGLLLWQQNMSKLNKEIQNQVSTIIKKSINQQLDVNPFLPNVILLNSDSSESKQLSDTLKAEITSFIIDYYLNSEKKNNYENIDFQPYFMFSQKPNKIGQFVLTTEQMANLKSYVNFIVKKVEVEVDRTKEEVNRDIDRLNTWVTIWIGFIGLIGIFIPIILNIDVSKNISEAIKSAKIAKEKSEEANNKANEAISIIASKQESIDKIENIESKVSDVEALSNDAISKAEKAKEKSMTAIQETKLVKNNLSLIMALGTLKEFDANVIIQLHEEKRIPFLRGILYKIKNEINNHINNSENKLLLNWLSQFAANLQTISLYKFIDRDLTESLNDLAILISKFIKDNTEEKYLNIITKLDSLLNEIE